MKARNLLLTSTSVAAVLATASTADAASTYASIFGGLSFLNNAGLKGHSQTLLTSYGITLASQQSVDTGFKTGFVVGGNWGVDWGNFRTELEVSYHQNNSGKHARVTTHYSYHYSTAKGTPLSSTSSNSVVPSDLTLRAYAVMANVWYDFHDMGSSWGITPYIGGGVGVAQVQIDGALNNKSIFERNDSVFAWQVGAGFSMPLSDSTQIFFDYRYFSAKDAHLYIEPGYNGGDINANFDSHNALVGIRFAL